MNELEKILLAAASSEYVIVPACIVVYVYFVILARVGFKEGRSIEFFPPSIGERPRPSSTHSMAQAGGKRKIR